MSGCEREREAQLLRLSIARRERRAQAQYSFFYGTIEQRRDPGVHLLSLSTCLSRYRPRPRLPRARARALFMLFSVVQFQSSCCHFARRGEGRGFVKQRRHLSVPLSLFTLSLSIARTPGNEEGGRRCLRHRAAAVEVSIRGQQWHNVYMASVSEWVCE
jgi:hypothetical protein